MTGVGLAVYTEAQATERLAAINATESRDERVRLLGALAAELDALLRHGPDPLPGWTARAGDPRGDTHAALDKLTIWVRTALHRAEREHLPRPYAVAGKCPECGLPLWRVYDAVGRGAGRNRQGRVTRHHAASRSSVFFARAEESALRRLYTESPEIGSAGGSPSLPSGRRRVSVCCTRTRRNRASPNGAIPCGAAAWFVEWRDYGRAETRGPHCTDPRRASSVPRRGCWCVPGTATEFHCARRHAG